MTELTDWTVRNDFNEPRLLNIPIHRKALKSLIWDVFFVISSYILMSYCMFLSAKTPILAPPLRLWNSPSEQSEKCVPGCGPQQGQEAKRHSHLSGCLVVVVAVFSLQDFVFSTRFEPGGLEPKKLLQPSVTMRSSTPVWRELTKERGETGSRTPILSDGLLKNYL